MTTLKDMLGAFDNPRFVSKDQERIAEITQGSGYSPREIVMVGFREGVGYAGIFLSRRGEVEMEDARFTHIYDSMFNLLGVDPGYLSEGEDLHMFFKLLTRTKADPDYLDLGGATRRGMRRVAIEYCL